MKTSSQLPDNHIEICRELAAVAKKHGLSTFSASYDPAFGDPWRDKINVSWDSGRHGDASNRLVITSTTQVFTKVEVGE